MPNICDVVKGSLGDRLRRCRKARGQSANDIAAAVGKSRRRKGRPVHRQTIYRWEWGPREPSLEYLRVLAAHFQCSLSWLVSGAGDGPRYLRHGGG